MLISNLVTQSVITTRWTRQSRMHLISAGSIARQASYDAAAASQAAGWDYPPQR